MCTALQPEQCCMELAAQGDELEPGVNKIARQTFLSHFDDPDIPGKLILIQQYLDLFYVTYIS